MPQVGEGIAAGGHSCVVDAMHHCHVGTPTVLAVIATLRRRRAATEGHGSKKPAAAPAAAADVLRFAD